MAFLHKLWWLSDVTIFLATYMTFKHEEMNAFILGLGRKALEIEVLGSSSMPQMLQRAMTARTPIVVYNIIRSLFLFGFAWNILVNAVSETQRSGVINLLFTYLSLVIGLISARNVLLNDEVRMRNRREKIEYVFFPINDDESIRTKAYGKDRVLRMVDQAIRALRRSLWSMSLCGLIISFMLYFSPGLYLLTCPIILFMHLEANISMNSFLDFICLKAFKDTIFHPFQDVSLIVIEREIHPQLGLQYTYFYSFNKIFTQITDNYILKNRQKPKLNISVSESLALSLMLRSLLTIFLLHQVHLLNFDLIYTESEARFTTRCLIAILPCIAYYFIHGAGTIYFFSRDYPLQKSQLRLLLLGESFLSGLLFYKPVIAMYLK